MVEAETAYGSDNPLEMVVQYLWGTLQAHQVMDIFFRTQFFQYPEMYPHITLYLFENRSIQVEVSDLKHKVEVQAKTLNQMEKTYR